MKRLTVFLLALALTVSMLSGCARPAADEAVFAVTVSPGSVALKPGEHADLTASVTKNGSPVEADINWTSADESVATVANGRVTAAGIGQTTVYAEYEGESAPCAVTVREVLNPVANLTLDRSAASLFVGGSLLLTASVRKGADVLEAAVSWSAQPSDVAAVDEGTVTALRVGAATVTASATYEGKTLSAACKITIDEKVELKFTVPEVKLLVNRAVEAPVEVLENDVAATDAVVGLSTGDPSIVTVTGGKLLGLKSGATTVTATYRNKSVTSPIAVYDRTVSTFDEFSATRSHLDKWNLLIADVDAAGKSFAPWNAWGTRTNFTGVFDGNGHTVSNLTVTASSNNALAVGIAAGGVLKNTAFTGMKHSHNNHSTGLIMQNYGTIENVYVENELYYTSSVTSSNTQFAGAIAAQNGGVVRDCVAVLTHQGIDLNDKAGVAVGRNFDSVNGRLERVFGVDGTSSGRALVASTQYPGSVVDSAAADSASALIEQNRALMEALPQGVWDVSGLKQGALPTLIAQPFAQGETVVIPSSLTLGGQYKTRFTIGEDFSYEGLIVTLVNSDGTQAPLTENDYTVSCEAFDKKTPAVYTVSVVYKAQPSIAATYTVTVAAPSTDEYELTVPSGQAVFADPALAGIDVGRALAYSLTKGGLEASADVMSATWEDVTGEVENKAGVAFTGDKATGTGWGNATVKLTVTTAAGSVTATADVKVYIPITAGILNKTVSLNKDTNRVGDAMEKLQSYLRAEYDVAAKKYTGWFLMLEDLDFAQVGNKKTTVYQTTAIGFMGNVADTEISASYFAGVFDGNGYAMRHVTLYCTNNLGLFTIRNGTVRNLSVEMNYTSSGAVCSNNGLIAKLGYTEPPPGTIKDGGTVENVRLKVDISAMKPNTLAGAGNYNGMGLLIGAGDRGSVQNCLVEVTGTPAANAETVGAIAGRTRNSEIAYVNCIAVGAVRPIGYQYSSTTPAGNEYTTAGSSAYGYANLAALVAAGKNDAALWGSAWTIAEGALPALKAGVTANATITEA